MADLSDQIETAAGQPKRAMSGDRSAEAHPLPDQIAADKYLKSGDAIASAGSAWGCLRPARMVPPGTVGPAVRDD